jgi:hypothetical protein
MKIIIDCIGDLWLVTVRLHVKFYLFLENIIFGNQSHSNHCSKTYILAHVLGYPFLHVSLIVRVSASPRVFHILFSKIWCLPTPKLVWEGKKEVISKSFLYFYPKSFFLGTFSYDPVSCFVSETLNLFLYAFNPFHQIFLSCAFLTWNSVFLPFY